MTSPQDPDLDALASLSGHLSAALGAIRDDQVTLVTPCADWDLTALVDHVTGGNWFTSRILAGGTAEQAMANARERFGGGSASRNGAILSVDDQLVAFTRPGALDRCWNHVAGHLTGRQILRLRLHDLIVHTWDIEETVNPPATVPETLVAWGLAELSDEESLAPKHFGLARPPTVDGVDVAATTYLRGFGR